MVHFKRSEIRDIIKRAKKGESARSIEESYFLDCDPYKCHVLVEFFYIKNNTTWEGFELVPTNLYNDIMKGAHVPVQIEIDKDGETCIEKLSEIIDDVFVNAEDIVDRLDETVSCHVNVFHRLKKLYGYENFGSDVHENNPQVPFDDVNLVNEFLECFRLTKVAWCERTKAQS